MLQKYKHIVGIITKIFLCYILNKTNFFRFKNNTL